MLVDGALVAAQMQLARREPNGVPRRFEEDGSVLLLVASEQLLHLFRPLPVYNRADRCREPQWHKPRRARPVPHQGRAQLAQESGTPVMADLVGEYAELKRGQRDILRFCHSEEPVV